jgi:hypothetical protein
LVNEKAAGRAEGKLIAQLVKSIPFLGSLAALERGFIFFTLISIVGLILQR